MEIEMDEGERVKKTERSSVHCFISQIVITTTTRPDLWVTEIQLLGPPTAAFPGTLAGNWIRSQISGTQISTII